jgi:hypothetical protein
MASSSADLAGLFDPPVNLPSPLVMPAALTPFQLQNGGSMTQNSIGMLGGGMSQQQPASMSMQNSSMLQNMSGMQQNVIGMQQNTGRPNSMQQTMAVQNNNSFNFPPTMGMQGGGASLPQGFGMPGT